jgi:PPE-repeat protein
MNFSVWTPQRDSIRMLATGRSAPTSKAARWDGLAGELAGAATSFNSVTSERAGDSWHGGPAPAMTAATASYREWLSNEFGVTAGHLRRAPRRSTCRS